MHITYKTAYSNRLIYTFNLAGMGLLYVPEKKVTFEEILSEQLEVDENIINKVRAGDTVLYIYSCMLCSITKNGKGCQIAAGEYKVNRQCFFRFNLQLLNFAFILTDMQGSRSRVQLGADLSKTAT